MKDTISLCEKTFRKMLKYPKGLCLSPVYDIGDGCYDLLSVMIPTVDDRKFYDYKSGKYKLDFDTECMDRFVMYKPKAIIVHDGDRPLDIPRCVDYEKRVIDITEQDGTRTMVISGVYDTPSYTIPLTIRADCKTTMIEYERDGEFGPIHYNISSTKESRGYYDMLFHVHLSQCKGKRCTMHARMKWVKGYSLIVTESFVKEDGNDSKDVMFFEPCKMCQYMIGKQVISIYHQYATHQ